MNREEILNSIADIGTIEDEVERRDKLTSFAESLSSMIDDYEKATTENEKLKEDNEKLVDYNRKLFMKVAIDVPSNEIQKDLTGQEPEKEKRKFEELFDEKGNLKL